LIFDETGPAKKGTATAAVGRQYSGTMGRVENVIVAVYTTYATEHGHALIDRDLYVQRDWFADPARMAAAGFPADHAFATKPAPALAQAKRALAAGISPAWATGDEVYGRSAALREFCEAAGIGTCSRCPSITSSPPPGGCACARTRRSPWSSRKGGTAARAERARKAGAATTGRGSPPTTRGDGCSSGAPLAIRASWRISVPMRPEHRACSLTDLVEIAGMRWKVEDDFQDSKSTVGLDQTQVRHYRAWKRHATLAMAALAFLAVLAAIERAAHPAPVLPDHRDQLPPADCGIIALTVPEAQRLFHLLTTFTHNLPPHTVRDRITPHLSWSDWRRRHQARARWHHYRTRLTLIA